MSIAERQECLQLVGEAYASGARKELACELLGVDRRTLERWAKQPEDLRKGPISVPSNALTDEEQKEVLRVVNEPLYADLPPGQIVPQLADRGIYLASESTIYRILRKNNLLVHRSKSQPPRREKPEALVATGPNQIWSWDITYLRTSVRGHFYYLYLPMDIFSRKIIHWEVHEVENADLAASMITAACANEGIQNGQIRLHSDNGGPMKGATMLTTLHSLGIVPSRSRPSVSDDNPFSESLFKTLKYCPSYPISGMFTSIESAREWVEKFVHWYNNIHLHRAINWVTPTSRHRLLDQGILDQRKVVYEAARSENPNRWSKDTRNWSRPAVVELNPGKGQKEKKINISTIAS